MLRKAITSLGAALLLVLAAADAHATSTVNPNIPAVNAPLQSLQMRQNFQATATDINNIEGMFAGVSPPASPSVFQFWANTSATPYVISQWDGGIWVRVGLLDPASHAYEATIAVTGVSPIVVTDTAGAKQISLNTVTAPFGGTGRTTLTANNLLAGNGTGQVNLIAPGANGSCLVSNGTLWQAAACMGSLAATAPLQVVPSGTAATVSFINQTGNAVLASPAGGGSGAPTFRSLVNADVAGITALGTLSSLTVTGQISGGLIASGGASAGLQFNDQVNGSAHSWLWYSSANQMALYSNGAAGSLLTVTEANVWTLLGSGSLNVPGQISGGPLVSNASSAGLTLQDRTTGGSHSWLLYANSNQLNLNSANGNVWTVSENGTLGITPVAGTSAKGFNITQSGPTTGTFTGNVDFNSISVTEAIGETTSNYTISAFHTDMVVGGSNSSGQRQAIYGSISLTSPTSPTNVQRDYIAGTFVSQAYSGDNGTNTGLGRLGNFYGVNIQSYARSGATNLAQVTGGETDVGAFTGSTVYAVYGMSYVRAGQVQGASRDAVINVAAGGPAQWQNVIWLSGQAGAFGISGAVIDSDGTTATIAKGIDLYGGGAITITGNAWNSNGFTVSGVGAVTLGNQLTSALATGTAPFSVASTTRVANLNVARAGVADSVTNLTLAGAVSLPTVAQGDVWYGSATGVISALAKNTSASRYLANTGTSNNPNWDQINLANGVTGTLPIANGGTGDTGTAWLPYSPTITCGTGSVSGYTSQAGLYKVLLNKSVLISIYVQSSGAGSCSGAISVSLPVTPGSSIYQLAGRNQTTGDVITGVINGGNASVFTYNNANPGATNIISLSGAFQSN